MPLRFEVNAGQVSADVRFLARGAGYDLGLTTRGAVLSLAARRGPESTAFDAAVLGLTLVGAAPNPRMAGLDPLAGRANYYRGNDPSRWQTDVASFARVRYEQVYPGIDLVYYGNQGELQYDFHVAPGGDPSRIRFGVEGADTVALDTEGNLQIGLAGRTVRQRRPFTYQDVEGTRREVPSRFVLDGPTVRFEVGAYDNTRELVIDPALTYSTWFGGLSDEVILDVQIDGADNIVIAGYSFAAQGFPTTPGALRTLRTGTGIPSDAFVAKFNPAGTVLLFSTLLGGDGAENDLPQALNGGLGIDAGGNIHVTGLTRSSNFPTTAGAHDTSSNGALADGFYTKLSSTGGLLYSTYFGGTGEEIPTALAVEPSANIYIVGQTTSTTAAGFSTPGGMRTAIGGGNRDAFLLKFNSVGALTYGTYLAGGNATIAHDVAVAGTDKVVVVGATPGGATFPITMGAFQPSFAGGSGPGDAFLVEIDTAVAGTGGLLYGTFYGGSSDDAFNGVAVDSAGRVYAAGYTKSAGLVTNMAAGGGTPSGTRSDALIAKFDPSLSGAAGKVYAIRVAAVDPTLGDEQANDIAVDALGRAWVVGLHNGSALALINAFDSTAANLRPFVAQISTNGGSASMVSYAGGRNSNNTNLFGVALNGPGEVYVAGFSVEPTITSASLPLVSPFQAVYGGGGSDGTLQKIGFAADLSLTKVASPALPLTVLPGQPLMYTITLTNNSADPAANVVVSDSLPPQVTFVSCAATGGGVCGGTGANRSVTFATLAGGASATITLTTTVNSNVPPGTQWTNTATVGAQTTDPTPGNNTGGGGGSGGNGGGGTPSITNPAGDADGDGLPNGWEQQYGLNPLSNSPAEGAAGDPDGDGIPNAQEFANGSHPRGFVITYLAEGATGTFFDTRIALANPNTTQALVLTRFQKSDGTVVPRYEVVPPLTRATIDVETVGSVGSAEFSTLVEADVQVVVDRTMTWDDGAFGAHAERGILTRTATTWYLAEGATHGAFDLFYLLQNPNATPATVDITFLLPAPEPPVVKHYTVNPGSRLTIWVDLIPELQATDVSAVITSTNGVPIIVERAMYSTSQGRTFNAGHESAGVTSPANAWFLAEGATGTLFDMFVLIANPNPQDATVQARYLLTDGTVVTKMYPVAANSRRTIWVDLEDPLLANASLSTAVTSLNNVPVIVERAMWWPDGPATWYEAHNSPGETVTGAKWAFAEGEVGGPLAKDTFILIANTAPSAGAATVTLLLENGTTLTKTVPLPANSRTTVSVRVDFPAAVGTRFGAVVESSGVPIVVERAMYWSALGSFWAAGTDALATKLQ